MLLPLKVTFRELSPSAAIDSHVRRRAQKLATFFERIMSCHVVVDAPHRSHKHGKRYHVRIDITVPGAELVVGRNPAANLKHEDVHAAIDDAFDDAQRVVEDFAHRLREDRKIAPRA